jgi:hypothetical protein
VTRAELRLHLEEHLDLERARSLRAHELARLDPRRIDPSLHGMVLNQLIRYEEWDALGVPLRQLALQGAHTLLECRDPRVLGRRRRLRLPGSAGGWLGRGLLARVEPAVEVGELLAQPRELGLREGKLGLDSVVRRGLGPCFGAMSRLRGALVVVDPRPLVEEGGLLAAQRSSRPSVGSRAGRPSRSRARPRCSSSVSRSRGFASGAAPRAARMPRQGQALQRRSKATSTAPLSRLFLASASIRSSACDSAAPSRSSRS